MYKFNKLVDVSFVPELIRLADRLDIKICFVQVKSRKIAEGKEFSSDEIIYNKQQEDYFGRNGVCFIDMNNNEKVIIDMFSDGSHIKKGSMREYTEIFYEIIKEYM